MKKANLKIGFTLIEILVVVTIIAMLVVIALYGSLAQASHLARDARRKADIENTRAVLESYRSTNGGYPDLLIRLTSATPPYLKTVATDPVTNISYTYLPTGCVVVGTLTLCTTYTIAANLETVQSGQYVSDPLGSIVTTPVPTAAPTNPPPL